MKSEDTLESTLFPNISGPLSEDYPKQLISLWNQRFPGLDASAAPLFSLLRIAGKLLDNFHESVLKNFDFTLAEYLIVGSLRTLGEGATMTPKDLNKTLMQTSAGITKTLSRLEKSGYIGRIPNPKDKRSVLVSLTESGAKIADQISLSEAKAQRKKSALLSIQDMEKIIDIQRMVIRMLGD